MSSFSFSFFCQTTLRLKEDIMRASFSLDILDVNYSVEDDVVGKELIKELTIGWSGFYVAGDENNPAYVKLIIDDELYFLNTYTLTKIFTEINRHTWLSVYDNFGVFDNVYPKPIIDHDSYSIRGKLSNGIHTADCQKPKEDQLIGKDVWLSTCYKYDIYKDDTVLLLEVGKKVCYILASELETVVDFFRWND